MTLSEFLPLLCCLVPLILAFWFGYVVAMRKCQELEG